MDRADVTRISTGLPSVDFILGGGLPEGRIIEIYGPESSGKTSLSIMFLAQVQKKYPKSGVAFIDVEHALDPDYAQQLGLNMDELILSQPDSAEQALNIMNELAASGEIKAIILDSVAKLVPRKEVEGEVGDAEMAMRARLMGQALRKIVPNADKNKCTCFFINQVRNSVGITYGCHHADNIIYFDDGRKIKIRDVVNKKIVGNIIAWDEKTNKYVTAPIINWFNNGKITDKSEWITIRMEGIDSTNGVNAITVTKNHKLLTQRGWVEAQNIIITDKIHACINDRLQGTLAKQFMYGVSVGDSSIRTTGKNKFLLKLQDIKNKDYVYWKADKLHILGFDTTIKNKKRLISRSGHDLANFNYQRNPMDIIDKLDWLGFAIWLMDDGHLDLDNYHCRYALSIGRLKDDKDALRKIVQSFTESFKITPELRKDGLLIFSAKDSRKIAQHICTYIPDSMQYKLPVQFRGRYIDFNLETASIKKEYFTSIISIDTNSARKYRNKDKYDIEVKDYHNYICDGIVVHNSPELRPGGRALPFDASVILRTSFKQTTDEKIGETKIMVKKNKVGKPFRSTTVQIEYGKGFNVLQDTITMALTAKVITQKGAFYYFGDKQWQGQDAVRQAIADDPKLAKDIIEIIHNSIVT